MGYAPLEIERSPETRARMLEAARLSRKAGGDTWKSFMGCMRRMRRYGAAMGCTWHGLGRHVTFLMDFCDPLGIIYSIGFKSRPDADPTSVLSGAMLLHGPRDGFGSGSGPAFAVTLEKASGWTLHH